jgi:hypothetical protein
MKPSLFTGVSGLDLGDEPYVIIAYILNELSVADSVYRLMKRTLHIV